MVDIGKEGHMRCAWLRQTIVSKDETMKPTLFVTSTAIILLATAASGAGLGRRYITEVGRNIGYGVGDGYHADRYCLSACAACSSCSPVQQPMMQQPMTPYPTVAPDYSQWAPHQLQQVRYPVGYYAPPMYQPQYAPQYQPVGPAYGQPTPAFRPVARPDRSPASLW